MAKLKLDSEEDVILRGIAYDLDGTKRDTGYDAYRAFCSAVVELGGAAPSYHAYVARHHTVGFRVECGVNVSADEFRVVFREYQKPDVPPPFPDVLPFLERMGGLGVRGAIVTTSRTVRTVPWLQSHGLSDKYDHVACEVGGIKAPAIEEACRRMGLLRSMVCYVGDTAGDMLCAARAGVIPVGITRGYGALDVGDCLRQAGAKLVVRDLDELSACIE